MKQHDKSMKWLFIGLTAAIAAAIAGGMAVRRSRRPKSTDDIDGGVVKRYWSDAPKVIKSTEIVRFHCEISLFAVCDVDDLGHRVYTLDATLSDGKVLVRYDWYERNGGSDKAEYTADTPFMAQLHGIVSEYDFAKYNGYYHAVSGLPGMYGESLHIAYKSGECIDVHDNQSGFLPIEAIRALLRLFGAVTKLENQ